MAECLAYKTETQAEYESSACSVCHDSFASWDRLKLHLIEFHLQVIEQIRRLISEEENLVIKNPAKVIKVEDEELNGCDEIARETDAPHCNNVDESTELKQSSLSSEDCNKTKLPSNTGIALIIPLKYERMRIFYFRCAAAFERFHRLHCLFEVFSIA
jgi:hypothetical protein